MTHRVVKRLNFDDESIYSVNSPQKRSKEINDDENFSANENCDFSNIKKKILHYNKKTTDEISYVEIYQDIVKNVQQSIKTDSDNRTSFVLSIEKHLNSLEKTMEANLQKDDHMYSELMEALQQRDVHIGKLKTNLNNISISFQNLMGSILKKEEELIKERRVATENFMRNMNKFRDTLPEITLKERAAKEEAFRKIISTFSD